ncbi:MAG: hypothetical protein KTR33_11765 [Gammaproteobacteria bacterium]|nr:hypothetical protein [Gammaproteobacteria bacterium]
MDKSAPFPFKKVLIILLVLVVLAGMGAVSYWYFLRVRPVTSLMAKAEEHIQNQEWGAGVRAAKRVLQLKPRHLEANLLAGDILFQFRHPATKHFYTIAYTEAPERWDVWKRLVDYHILMSDRYLAQQMIDNPPAGAETSETWWEAYFNFSLKSGDMVEARKAAETLIEMNTAKELSWDFVLAQINAQQPDDPELRKSGQQRLLEFYQDSPRWRHSAARIYIESVGGDGNSEEAVRFIREWLKIEDIPFEDILFCLNAASQVDAKVTATGMELLQRRAKTNEELSQAMQWMLGRKYDEVMWRWLQTQDETVLSSPEVLSILSIYTARQKDWITLREHLLADIDQWEGYRSLYHLYTAYIESQTRKIINVPMLRQSAREAGQERNGFLKLRQACIRLDWQRGWKEVLPFLMYEPNVSFAAVMVLYREAVEEQRYEDMLKIAVRAYSVKPDDYAASNNYAYLSLIYGSEMEGVHEIALKNYQQYPHRVNSVVTYGLSLWRLKQDQKAYELIDSVRDEILNTPPILYIRALIEATRDTATSEKIKNALNEGMFSPMEWNVLRQDPKQRAEPTDSSVELTRDKNDSLKQLLQESNFKKGWAARTLIKSLLQDGKESDAYDLIEQWLEQGNLGFEDAFFALTTIRSGEREVLQDKLMEICRQRADQGEDVARLLRWEIGAGQADRALKWLAERPAEQQQSVAVFNVLADYYITQKDWVAIESQILDESVHWEDGKLDYHLIRAVTLSRAGDGKEENEEGVDASLKLAVEALGTDLVGIRGIENRLLEWGWPDGWQRFNRIYQQVQASERQRLQITRAREGQRPVLSEELKTAREFLEQTPDNAEAQARVAYYQLVAGEETEASHQMAAAAYQADSSGIMPLAAQLLSLVQQGEHERAAEMAQAIPSRWRYHPTLLLIQVLALHETLPSEAATIQGGLVEDKYSKEEWALLP